MNGSNKNGDKLTKNEFHTYMTEMKVDLENRITKLEAKLSQEYESIRQAASKPGSNDWKEKLIILLLGAVLALAGVVTGWQFF